MCGCVAGGEALVADHQCSVMTCAAIFFFQVSIEALEVDLW